MTDVRYVHQHFDRPARFGWFTAFEWLLVAVAAVVTAIWWRWLSWLDFSGTASVATLINLPLYAYARLKDDRGARGARTRLRVLWAWHAREHLARAGRASRDSGYVVEPARDDTPRNVSSTDRDRPTFEAFWR